MLFISNFSRSKTVLNLTSNIHKLSLLYFPSWKQKLAPDVRIICTYSRLLTAVQNHRIQPWQENLPQPIPEVPTAFLKDNFNIVDTRFIKLLTIPHDNQKLHEIISAKEFKDILSKSSFYYDVNLADNAKSPLVCSGVYFYSFENVFTQTLKSKAFEIEEVKCIGSSNENGKPSEEQLLYVIDCLTESLLHFFEKAHDYSFYHKNIIFQNNLRGVTIRGLTAYIQAMYILKYYGLFQYAKVKVDILKITHHTEDGTIRARWRMKYILRHKLLLKFLKLQSMPWQQFFQEEAEWLDGFSVFSVGPDGLIYKHVCDKMTPNDDIVTTRTSLRSKLLGLFELSPRGTAAGNLNSLVPCFRNQELLSGRKLS